MNKEDQGSTFQRYIFRLIFPLLSKSNLAFLCIFIQEFSANFYTFLMFSCV